jgi:hypothetical protein
MAIKRCRLLEYCDNATVLAPRRTSSMNIDNAEKKLRESPEEITRGLKTTSDKVRALARAGYLRTEISKLLDIRYQHVRNVLVDAGIKGGLQHPVEMERSSDTIEVHPSEREPTPPSVLLEAGFQPLGEWRLADGKIELDSRAPTGPGVYAFILEEAVVYVGVTQNGLRTRMDQYRQGHSGQRTSARVNGLIRQALEAGQRVTAMIAMPPALEWNGLPIDGSAGLEVGLIELIQPVWNMRGVT